MIEQSKRIRNKISVRYSGQPRAIAATRWQIVRNAPEIRSESRDGEDE